MKKSLFSPGNKQLAVPASLGDTLSDFEQGESVCQSPGQGAAVKPTLGITCLSVHPYSLSQLFLLPGQPYSKEWKAEWSYLYSLASNIRNSGFFTFIPQPASQQYQKWRVGALRIVSNRHYLGKK